jgi:hypothetical protein
MADALLEATNRRVCVCRACTEVDGIVPLPFRATAPVDPTVHHAVEAARGLIGRGTTA